MIPDFILKGDKQDAAPEAVRCTELIQEYIKKIGGPLITENSYLSDEEWIEILEECLRTGKTYWEVTGESYMGDDKDTYY